MASTLGPASERVVTGVYNPENALQFEHARNADEISRLWSLKESGLALPSVDELLSNHVERLAKAGKSTLTLLDLGSGRAGLLQDIVRGEKLPLLKQALAVHPEMRLVLHGITDAASAADYQQTEEYRSDRVEAYNHHYSLTARQRIADVVPGKFDLIVSTIALSYLGESSFERVMTDSFSSLNPGGEMIAVGYVSERPGFISLFQERFDLRGVPADAPSWLAHLKAIEHGDYLSDKTFSPDEALSWMREIEEHLAHLPEFGASYYRRQRDILMRDKLYYPSVLNLKGKLARFALEKLDRELFQRGSFNAVNALFSNFRSTVSRLALRKSRELMLQKMAFMKNFLEVHEVELSTQAMNDTAFQLVKK